MPRGVRNSANKKEYPLSMRLPAADVAIIDRAAGIRGRSRTDFVRDAAVRAAEEAIMESALIKMSPRGFAAFMAALGKPGAVIPDMVADMKRRAPWEKGSSSK
jgi:uncharacterized protein (DUF1778 family)